MFKNVLGLTVATLLPFLLVGCGGSGFSQEEKETPDEELVHVESIYLMASSSELPSAGSEPVTLTAYVRGRNNQVLENVPVVFGANNDGWIQAATPLTDENGAATAKLTTPSNKSNRTINVSATAAGVTEEVPVEVTGTSIEVSGPGSASFSDTLTYTLRLADSNGEPISGQAISLHSETGTIHVAEPVTDNDGEVRVEYTAGAGGTESFTALAMGAVVSQTINVTAQTFAFVIPDSEPRSEINLNESQELVVELRDSGVAVIGQRITFNATRGTLTAADVDTDGDGRARVDISANTAGPSTVTAVAYKGTDQEYATSIELLFVATEPDKMTLQAEPSAIAPLEQATISAVVRDANNNLVKNQEVLFSISDVSGGSLSSGSAVTNEFGRATTIFTAGGSTNNKVLITASLGDIKEEIELSVAQAEAFITLGTGNTVIPYSETRYHLPYSALVTDTEGAPMANVKLSLSIWPEKYKRGEWLVPEGSLVWVQNVTQTCHNEDLNRNGVWDEDETITREDEGILTPGNVATFATDNGVLAGRTIELETDESGFVEFYLAYQKEYARWVDVELTASTLVVGDQSRATRRFTLPILAADVSGAVTPPGQVSPFDPYGCVWPVVE